MKDLTFSAKVNLIKDPRSNLKGYATLVINGLVELSGFRIVEGQKGLFAAVPQTKGTKQDENGKDQYFDNIRFSDMSEEGHSATKQAIQSVILEAYGTALAEQNTSSRGNTANARTQDPAPTNKRPGMARATNW